MVCTSECPTSFPSIPKDSKAKPRLHLRHGEGWCGVTEEPEASVLRRCFCLLREVFLMALEV